MKACRNPKCFYHVESEVVIERENGKNVTVHRCTEGFKNRIKFMPSQVGFCWVCASAIALAIEEDIQPIQRRSNQL